MIAPELIAAHEAGHLAAAVAVGIMPREIRAAHPGTAEVRYDLPRSLACLDRAVLAAAGIVAEHVLGWPLRFTAPELATHGEGDGLVLAAEVAHGIDPYRAYARADQLLTAAPLAELAAELAGVGFITWARLAARLWGAS
jgi:hypothetical protein